MQHRGVPSIRTICISFRSVLTGRGEVAKSVHNFQSKSSFLPRYLSKIKANRRLNEHPPAYIDFFSIFFFARPAAREAPGTPRDQPRTPARAGRSLGTRRRARARPRGGRSRRAERADRAAAPAWPVDDPALQTAVARSPGAGATRGARFDAKKKIEKKKSKKKP